MPQARPKSRCLRALPALCVALVLGSALSSAGLAAQGPAAVPAGQVLAAPPANPDPRAAYLFYLHGQIVEDQGEAARHPRFGRYEYRAILTALTARGAYVISEPRPARTPINEYARQLVAQIEGLIAAGVPPTRISVVGASKGGAIALAASRALEPAGIGYVVLAGCSSSAPAGGLHGDVLSIREDGDRLGQSCERAFARSPEVGAHRELVLHTGLQHGFLYRPLPAWVEPALSWLDARLRS